MSGQLFPIHRSFSLYWESAGIIICHCQVPHTLKESITYSRSRRSKTAYLWWKATKKPSKH